MKYLFRALFKFYKLVISPLLGTNCRFLPTCSEYAEEAINKHGTIKGSVLAAKRLCKCHPFSKGGIDNVPER